MVAVIYSNKFLEHDTGPGHPERPERLQAIRKALSDVPWASRLTWQQPTAITDRDPISWVEQIHPQLYRQKVANIAKQGGGLLDADTVISPRSYEVALLAVNAWLDGVDWVVNTHTPAFVAARPPGHHAERSQGMGFCLFANAAIAAHYALTQPQIERVAILDWDVHHGNGTQAIVASHPQLAYCSLHQSPCYPGTGFAHERGQHQNVLNIPLLPGSAIADYRPPFTQQVIPFLQEFRPDVLIISAGYDANRDDPLASLNLLPQDYGELTTLCLQITQRIVFGLEGGYDLPSLSASVIATLDACLTALTL